MNATTTTAYNPKVPAEFRGMARDFINRLTVSDTATEVAITGAMRYLRGVIANRPVGKFFRPEHLETAVQKWCQQPAFGLLSEHEIQRGRSKLDMRSLRVTAADSKEIDWSETESGLMISQHTLAISKRRIHQDSGPLVFVCFHALGRRYQRGFGAGTDAAIMDDIRALALNFVAVRLTERDIGRRLEIGSWRGEIVDVLAGEADKKRRFLCYNIRTLL